MTNTTVINYFVIFLQTVDVANFLLVFIQVYIFNITHNYVIYNLTKHVTYISGLMEGIEEVPPLMVIFSQLWQTFQINDISLSFFSPRKGSFLKIIGRKFNFKQTPPQGFEKIIIYVVLDLLGRLGPIFIERIRMATCRFFAYQRSI